MCRVAATWNEMKLTTRNFGDPLRPLVRRDPVIGPMDKQARAFHSSIGFFRDWNPLMHTRFLCVDQYLCVAIRCPTHSILMLLRRMWFGMNAMHEPVAKTGVVFAPVTIGELNFIRSVFGLDVFPVIQWVDDCRPRARRYYSLNPFGHSGCRAEGNGA
ncbi:hypothetical protein BOA8489_01470 [Boseongicola aestuarii]|uniref:Uncharacterized protein n=1 Tax=Boseongicola aestuarii TaxID=1470561 RepID=A0A238J0D5_9RHOB|nr:hypothetical protein BOA8489_01470 [Boseongicola aestuarii]